MLFENKWVFNTLITTAEIRKQNSSMINTFFEDLDVKLITSLGIPQKKNSLNITLNQECTRAAHYSLQVYLDCLAHGVCFYKIYYIFI